MLIKIVLVNSVSVVLWEHLFHNAHANIHKMMDITQLLYNGHVGISEIGKFPYYE